MKKILLIGLLIILSVGVIGCNPFNRVDIEFHLNPETSSRAEIIEFKVGDTTGTNFPMVKSVSPGSYDVEWTLSSTVIDMEESYTENDDEEKFFIDYGQIKREYELD